MKSSKGGNNTQEEDEDYEEDFISKREPSSATKDAKSNDKVSAMRSKHSVTEQRRRSKINERFQILRNLMPHGDQKRDTASFLLEVIEYVQVLQEKVQKYEGPYEAWNTEPTKLMPWRHNHWRVQNLLGHPQAIKNGPGLAETFAGKFDEHSISMNPSLTVNAQTPAERDSLHESSFGISDEHLDLGENHGTMSTPFQTHMPTVVRSDGDVSHLTQRPSSESLSSHCTAIGSDDQIGEHMIEGGTISISSAYSHGLLTTLTKALESSGVDLTHANISIRIDLGKRANQTSVSGISAPIPKEEQNPVSEDCEIGHNRDGSSKEELGQPQKRLKS